MHTGHELNSIQLVPIDLYKALNTLVSSKARDTDISLPNFSGNSKAASSFIQS